MKVKYTVVVIILLLMSGMTSAQDVNYAGKWFVTYNYKHRQSRGNKYAINIEKVGAVYMLSWVDNDYTTSLPPEGAYTLNAKKQLVHGSFTISATPTTLSYDKDGLVELLSMDFYEKTIKIFEEGADLITKADSAGDKKDEYLARSITYTKVILQGSPKCIECYYNIAVAWYKLGNIDSSIAAYYTMNKLDTAYEQNKALQQLYTQYYTRNAWKEYGEKENFKLAIAELKKGMKFNPTDADLLYNLGGAYFSDKQYANAVLYFRKCLKQKPEYAEAQQGLSAAQKMLGH